MTLTSRISHPALTGTENAETIAFYTELLGMELVRRQPNLDYPSEEHLFFHAGNDTFIAYFVPREGEDLSAYGPARPGCGGRDHLALDVEDAAFEEARGAGFIEDRDVRQAIAELAEAAPPSPA